jgi:hypothetical protein
VADVELRVGDLDAEAGEALQRGGQGAAARGAADDEMALEADTVNGGARGLDDLDELDGAVRLGLVVLQVVVVVVPRRGVELEPDNQTLTRGRWVHPYSLVPGSAALARLNDRGR